VNLLLDTHAVIWAFSNDSRLSPAAREAIEDGSNPVFVSAVSAWEIVIKKALGKLEAPDNYREELDAHAFIALDITTAHAVHVGDLPAHHQDPFDRLLVAQAQVEGLTIVTRDVNVQRYDVSIVPT
jgi:PIN domain nuclease of toxin-antitoxin system